MNKVILIGNVGDDPEIRSTGSGTRIAKVSLATNRKWTNRDTGQKNEETEWHKLTFFGKVCDVVESYVAKGDRIAVEGRLHYSTTTDDAGQKKYWTEVIVDQLELLGGGNGAGGSSAKQEYAKMSNPDEDDLPF
jgi:single-strand DNA-binding protein